MNLHRWSRIMHGTARLGGLLVVLFHCGASRPQAQTVAQRPQSSGEWSTVDTTRQPLFVVNGVVRPPSATPRDPVPEIAPEDIESIEILKGPAAVAAYGPAAQNGAILIRLFPVPAATPENRARQVAALNGVMEYRVNWMRDSTQFESCALFRALAQPATFPDGIEPRFRALLNRTENPCATASAPNADPAWIHAVYVRSIRLEESTGTAFLYVRHGEDTHHEDFKLERHGERWWVTEVRLWGAVQSYPAHPYPR